MTLLREIQDNAVGKDASAEVLLRQCLVLASRLQHDELRVWATQELRGYPPQTERPEYRKPFHTNVLGTFNGGFGQIMKNAGIPQFTVPEGELREHLFSAEVREGVGQIEQLLSSGESTFQIPWPADVVAIFQRREIYQGMVLMEAWQVIPATAYSSVLGGIRERVLQFALDIERLDPAAGEAAPNERPLAEPQIAPIFHQNFFGDNTTLAVGGRDVTQTVSAVPLDVDGLVAALQELGIDKDEQEILVEAVRSDQQDGAFPGPQTHAWIERLRGGTVQLGSGVAIGTATDLIMKLLHLS